MKPRMETIGTPAPLIWFPSRSKHKQRRYLLEVDSSPVSQGRVFLDRCIQLTSPLSSIDTILDKTIIGDTFEVAKFLPPQSVDLLIVDPPYNLRKIYNGLVLPFCAFLPTPN